MFEKLYPFRFTIFIVSQIVVLFGSLLIPSSTIGSFIVSLFFIINLIAGIVVIGRNRLLFWMFAAVFLFMVFNSLLGLEARDSSFRYIKISAYFTFYSIVTIKIIKQVWESKIVNTNIIFGLISGYISLGLIGFFICLTIEITNPGSFEGLNAIVSNKDILTERLMYFSYITLLTIGYGDILPVTALAQKAAILIGLLGQVYLVVITAIVIGKYINQLPRNDKDN